MNDLTPEESLEVYRLAAWLEREKGVPRNLSVRDATRIVLARREQERKEKEVR